MGARFLLGVYAIQKFDEIGYLVVGY